MIFVKIFKNLVGCISEKNSTVIVGLLKVPQKEKLYSPFHLLLPFRSTFSPLLFKEIIWFFPFKLLFRR